MKILVINAGSSSIKYQVFDLDAYEQVLCSGLMERIGESSSRLKHTVTAAGHEGEIRKEQRVRDHEAGMALIVEVLQDPRHGVIHDTSDIAGVGHRVLHCGEAYSDTVRIDEKVIATIKEYIPLGPLHNPPNLTGILVAQEFFPKAAQVAVFDTAFHQSIPRHAFMYALPYEFYTRHRVRRYGFHGTSHKFITHETARFLQKPVDHVSLISIHLGNGCSMAAVHKGKCVDTTMGLTPLEGLVMGTRCGDLDPAIHEYLAGQTGKSLGELTDIMNKQSGLKGLCGTNDVREVLAKYEAGDPRAVLAIDMYCYRIKKYIGAYSAVLPEMDAIVFTAGVGQNASFIRDKVCQGLDRIGIVLDNALNNEQQPGARAIHAAYSPVKILIIPTNEELQIARETKALLQPARPRKP
jgi:acetate kinase